ncbi:hypothetical protein Pcinc_002344 [Petrolisthes cinctipes]|uniref:Uncharacterized protein n=1 Tax=Petrolisthes cinctipes TaxID=88211 RepID=A0AAE1GL70_PETCI|nr:hypothetical protein Pcinc_002344 [Petrolisthes cinctipes]
MRKELWPTPARADVVDGVEAWGGEWSGGARDVELESGPGATRGMAIGVEEFRSLESGPEAARGLESGPGATHSLERGVVESAWTYIETYVEGIPLRLV